MFTKNFMFYQANAAGESGSNGVAGSGDGASGNNGNSSNNAALTFETWQQALPAEQKALIETHTSGLKSALESERGTRKDLEKQLREMAKKAEAGSDAQTQLTKLADDIQAADRKADFYESAHAAGVKNLKLAYTVAVSEDLFDKRGGVNFVEMKKSYPELFGATKVPDGNAGNGTNRTAQPNDMNARIRSAAGRG